MRLGLVDEDETPETTDRTYWEKRATSATLKLVDEVYEMIKEVDPELGLNYNKYYIGLTKDGRTNNFIDFRPKKQFMHMDPKIEKDSALEEKMEESGMDFNYNSRGGRYRITLHKGDVQKHSVIIKELIKQAHTK
jgi:predicted transport protein